MKRVVLVGHCSPDTYMLRGVVERAAPGVEVARATTDEELARERVGADLLVVNRVLDGEFADTSGLEVVRSAAAAGIKAMLVSNFPEALAEAELAGGLPGFGKRDAGKPETTRRILAALGLG